MLRIRNTVRDSATRAQLVDRYQTDRELLILRGIEAGEGITVDIVSNDPAVYATSEKVIRISAASTLPESGEEGEVLTIGPEGEFIWTLPPGAGGGETNTGANLIGDTGVYASKVGSELRFRGITGGNGITASQSATTITLAVDEGDFDLAAMSGNLPVPLGGTGRTTLTDNAVLIGNGAGGIDSTPTATTGYLYYNGSAFSWTSPAVGEVNVAASLGGDAAVYANKSGTTLNFRGISGGDGVAVTQNANFVSIAVDATEIDLNEFDGVVGVAKGGTGRISFPDGTLVVGNGTDGLDVTPPASNGYLRYNGGAFSWETPTSGETNVGASLGGAAIYTGKSGSTLNFRGLTVGNGISIATNANDLAISVNEAQINIANTTGTLPLNRGGTGATTASDARTALGLGSMAVQNANAVNITGGVATLTTLAVTGDLTLNGVAYSWPNADGTGGQILSTDGSGNLEWIDMATGGSGEVNTAVSLGGAAAIFAQKSGVQLQFRGLTGSDAILLSQNADHIAFALDESAIDLANTSGTLSVGRGGTGRTTLSSNAILLGNGTGGLLSITAPETNNVYLAYSDGSYAWAPIPQPGETNTASSLGGTADVFAQKDGVDLEFRGITAGNAVTVTEGIADITIAVDETGIDITNTTGNLTVARGGTGRTTVTPNALLIGNGANPFNTVAVPGLANTYLRWSGSAYEWGALPDAGETNTASSLGGDAAVFAQKNGEDLQFRGLTEGSGITLAENADEIVVSVNAAEIDVNDTTGTLSVARGGTGVTTLTDNAVVIGNGTAGLTTTVAATTGYLRYDGSDFVWDTPSSSITSLDDIGDVDVASAAPGNVLSYDGTNWIAIPIDSGGAGDGEVNTASNLPGDVGLFAQKDDLDLQFRSLTAGTGVTLTGNVDDIVIAIDETAIDVTNTTGTLPVARGGTGATTLTDNALLVGNGTGAVEQTPVATEGDYLAFVGGAFVWQTPTATVATLDDVGDVAVASDVSTGDVLTWDGDSWVSAAPGLGSGEANTASSAGGDVSLVGTKSGVNIPFRGLTAGNAVSLTENTDDVVIAVNEGDIDITNTTGTLAVGRGGTGQTSFINNSLVVGNGGSGFLSTPAAVEGQFLTFTGGVFSWATPDDTGEANTASSVGTGASVFAQKDGVDLEFRSIIGGNGIDVAENTDDLTLSVTAAEIAINDLSGTLSVAKGGTGQTTFTTNGILLGNGTGGLSATLAPTVADTVLSWNGTSFEWVAVAGEANTGTNLGTGTGVYSAKNGTALEFRTINGNSNRISIASVGDEIIFDVEETNIQIGNLAGTLSVAKGGTGATSLADNAILLGHGTDAVDVAPVPDTADTYLRWSGTAYEWAAVAAGTGEANSGNSLGGLANVYVNKTGTTLNFRGLSGSNGVTVSENTNDIGLAVNEAQLDLAAMGGTLGISQGGTGATTAETARAALGLGSMVLQNSNSVEITGGTATLDSITVNGTTTLNGVAYTWPVADGTAGQVLSTDASGGLTWIDASGESNDGASLGGEAGVFANKTGTTLNFRGISAGNGVDVTSDANVITVTVDETELDLANMGGTLGIAQGGTGAATAEAARTALGLGSMAEQDAGSVAITGGTIGGVAGSFTTLAASGATTFNGVSYTWPAADGTVGQILSTNADGTVEWIDAAAGGGETNLGESLGGEQAVYTGKSGVNLQFRGITAGNGVDLTADANAITVAVDESELDLANMGGTLSVAQGGTGASTFTANGVVVGDGTNALATTIAPSTADTYLHWTGTDFEWATISGGGGSVALDDVTDVDLTTDAPDSGDVLSYDGTNWVATNDAPVSVADDGTLVGTERQINFTGAGVTVTDDAANGRVNVAIPGGGGGGGGAANIIGNYFFEVGFTGSLLNQVLTSSPEFTVTLLPGPVVQVDHTVGSEPLTHAFVGISAAGLRLQYFGTTSPTGVRMEWAEATATSRFLLRGITHLNTSAGSDGRVRFNVVF